MESKKVIEMLSVKKSYESRARSVLALDEFSFAMHRGQFVIILGPSGCGKTTVLKLIAGLLMPDSGVVLHRGQRVRGPSIDRGMILQAYPSFPWLTVEGNIRFALKLARVKGEEVERIVASQLQSVGLVDYGGLYPEQLSGGMQQRLALARTLATSPEVLLLDEPFGALDFENRTLMQDLLVHLWQLHGFSVVFVTHDIEEAIMLGDIVYVCSARPARIKASIKIELDRPRLFSDRSSAVFEKARRRMHLLLKEEVRGTDCEERLE